MSITNHIKENPFAAIGLFLTLIGVGFTVVNFVILANVQPLTIRVSAIETRNDKLDEQLPEMWKYIEKVDRIEYTVEKIADRLGVIR